MKNKKTKKKGVLPDHKRVGKKLIPPLMQLEGMKSFSYADSLLPNFIWIAPLFIRSDDKVAVDQTIGFMRMCSEVIARDDAPPLAYLRNFTKLGDDEKRLIRTKAETEGYVDYLSELLAHHNLLLTEYPLSFLFEGQVASTDRDESIGLLMEDVDSLLDRYGSTSTKVQTTVFVSMLATGKMFLSSSIDLPDFDAIFKAPDSDEAHRVGSFVRATINSGAGNMDEGADLVWANSFWKQAYFLKGCA